MKEFHRAENIQNLNSRNMLDHVPEKKKINKDSDDYTNKEVRKVYSLERQNLGYVNHRNMLECY